MASYLKPGPPWGASSSTIATTTAQHTRHQTWASATLETGQNIISAMFYHSKGHHELGHQQQPYSSFRDEILMPPAYDSIVSPNPTPAPAPVTAPTAPIAPTTSATHTAPVSPPRHQQALKIPPLPRLLGAENLDEWDDVLRRTLRLHGLAEYITTPYPGVPEPTPTQNYYHTRPLSKYTSGNGGGGDSLALTHDQWESNRAIVCLLMVGSFSADVRDTLLAHGYDPSEENPKAIHDLVLEALPKAVGEDVTSWMRELGTISPSEPRFQGSLRNFCLQLQYLRRRLYQAEPQPNDNLVLVMAVLGLARCERYEEVSMALGKELERGGLTWMRLMGDLAALHGREVREKRRTTRSWKAVDDRPS